MEVWGSTRTLRCPKLVESGTKIPTAIITAIVCFISLIIIMSSMMIHIRRRKMCCEKFSSRNAPRRKRSAYTMAVPCTPTASSQAKERPVLMASSETRLISPGNRHSAKRMILISIYKSLRGSCVSIFLSHNRSTEARSSSYQTRNH